MVNRLVFGLLLSLYSTCLNSAFPSPLRAGTLEELIRSGALPPHPTQASSVTMIDHVRQQGRVTTVFLSQRPPRTRSAIHRHDDGGVTCVLEGELSLYIEGRPAIRKVAGECYYMPSDVRMIGFNSGRSVARFLDFFNHREGGRTLTIVEGGGCPTASGRLLEACSDNPYLGHPD
ncbi:MAG: hypothetical protein VKK62_02045 [Synechococcaceae cyanobacterium]|nr:hypothetical protein [Synechococcaceae cyanobacterium]